MPTVHLSDRRLPRFVLASLALHALAVLTLWQMPPRFEGQRDNVLSITLGVSSVTPSPAPVQRLIPSTTREQQQPRSPHAPSAFSSASESQASAHPLPAHADARRVDTGEPIPITPTRETEGSGSTAAIAATRIRAQLLTELARYFEYPSMARLRGWQGTVTVDMRVEPDGQLDRIVVARSSGYALLDQAALDSLRRVERIAGASAWLNGRNLDVQLPITYRLLDR